MPLNIETILFGMSTIRKLIKELRKSISHLKEKTTEKEAISPIERQVQELDNKLNTIRDGAGSINAYFELYGGVFELYTSGDDFIKSLSRAPDGTIDLLAEMNYRDLHGKFTLGIEQFPSTYSRYVDKNDEWEIKDNIKRLDKLLIQGKGHLRRKDYKELETTINELLQISNILRGISRKRVLVLTMDLQKVGGT